MKGQALLVIVLVMAVVLTVGLAVVSRSITNIRISTEQEESARVFSVAEAGIEEALRLGSALAEPMTIDIGDVTTVVEAVDDPAVVGGGGAFVFPKRIEAGNAQTVWLVDHNADGEIDPSADKYDPTPAKINVYWGNEGVSGIEAPALTAILFYREGGVFKTKKFAIDPYSGRGNSFDSAVGAGGWSLGEDRLEFKKELDLPSLAANDAYYLLRLRLIYNDSAAHVLGVEGVGDDLSTQGKCFVSCANHSKTGVTRCIRHCQPYDAPPGIFDYALYSASDLSK